MFGTIRFKALAFTVVFTMGLLIQVVVQYSHNEELKAHSYYLANTQNSIVQQLHFLQVSTIQIQQWLTDISATRGQDGLNDGFDEAESSARRFRQAVRELERLDPDSGIKYAELLPLMESYYQMGQKMAHAYIEGGATAGNKLMADFDATAEAIYGRVAEVDEMIQKQSQQSFHAQLEAADKSQQMNIIFSLMYLALLLAGLFGITRFILKPVGAMNHMAKDLAHGEGDLTQRLSIKGNNELAELAGSLNAFITKTDTMVSELMKSIVRLMPMSVEMSQTNLKIQAASLSQQSQSQNLSASMHATQAAAAEVSVRSDQISSSVAQSSQTLSDCQNIALKTRDSIVELRGEIEHMSGAISELSEKSEQIGSIIDVINSISDQTNLLALNAAIEAARAGEAGRGFSVVADEVRSLAARTREATVEVQSMINAIQAGTSEVKQTVLKGIQSAQDGVNMVNVTTDNLKELVDSVDQINVQATDIKQEILGQNNHFTQVLHTVETMQEDFQTALNHIEENLHFESDLKALSSKLKDMASKFQVTDREYSDQPRSAKRRD